MTQSEKNVMMVVQRFISMRDFKYTENDGFCECNERKEEFVRRVLEHIDFYTEYAEKSKNNFDLYVNVSLYLQNLYSIIMENFDIYTGVYRGR